MNGGVGRQLAALALVAGAVLLPALATAAPEATVLVVKINGPLVPVSRDYLARVLADAAGRQAAAVLLELDTPGGLVTTVREMVADMLESPVPVVVHVTPSGASAASGGVFLVLAADVAAMAPVSDMGAAHPIQIGGDNNPEDIGLIKAENELAALVRSLAEHRGRNPEAAEAMVRESRSYSAKEALEAGFIDLIIAGRRDLLVALEQRRVRRYDGSETVMHLENAMVEEVEMTHRERFLMGLSQPLVVLLLLAVGILGLYTEITNPGAILPAAVGIAALLLFGLASQALPVNWLAVALVVLGAGLLLLEIKVVSYGALTAGGLACLVIGGLMLFNAPPELQVPRAWVYSITLSLGLIAAFLVQLTVRSQSRPPTMGRQALVGLQGEALTAISSEGKVLVRGEYYDALAVTPVERGCGVEVVALEGRRLRVRRAPGSAPGASGPKTEV